MRPSIALCLSAILVAIPGTALAASIPPGFSAGLAGPVLTYVHLFGLLGLGLWLDMQGRGTPGAGAGLALAAGLIAGLVTRAGLHLPFAGLALEASLVVLGGLLAATLNLPAVVGLVMAAAVGALHGISLSQWGGPATSNILFWPGMLAGCVLVLSSGVGLSATLYQIGGGKASRVAGALIALAGLLMLLNIL
ncbi:HupE/UreJ family protein [Niveispirillum sp. KHB5.9]|uniref:HupE/UreJ family protein n=1 Tax=Niveispirillum sp. KHB5.9 TaxID=3400269 RepID=UPI003A868538